MNSNRPYNPYSPSVSAGGAGQMTPMGINPQGAPRRGPGPRRSAMMLKFDPAARDLALRQLAAAPVPAAAQAPAATPGASAPAAGQPQDYAQEWDQMDAQANGNVAGSRRPLSSRLSM